MTIPEEPPVYGPVAPAAGMHRARAVLTLAMNAEEPLIPLQVEDSQATELQATGSQATGSQATGSRAPESLPLAVLDFVGIEYGETAASALAGAVSVAQTVEAAGYRRYWVSEHHNMTSLACSAPELLIAHVGAFTSRIRVGAAGIMLPNHSALKVAETFRTLLAMYPGRGRYR